MLFVFSCVFLTLNIIAERDVGTHTHAVGVRAVQVHSREPCAAATHSEHSRPGSTIKDAPDAGVCRAAVPSEVTSTASQVTTGRFHRHRSARGNIQSPTNGMVSGFPSFPHPILLPIFFFFLCVEAWRTAP